MADKHRKSYYWICAITWSLWLLGIIMTAVFRYGNPDDPNQFFFSVVHPYNSVILVCSLIPVIPIVGLLVIVRDCKNKVAVKGIVLSVLMLAVTAVLWITYVSLFVWWTGGV